LWQKKSASNCFKEEKNVPKEFFWGLRRWPTPRKRTSGARENAPPGSGQRLNVKKVGFAILCNNLRREEKVGREEENAGWRRGGG